MAITTDDFNKIWASTSPLTPYSFSESQYKEGWNFIGSTPPSRQMWDFLQKNNDEKMQYLLNHFDNYLPLSGGTVTGDLTVTGALDGTASGNLPLSGGNITGDLSVTGTITGNVTGNVTGNADTATNATNDANGNPIASTYLPLSGGTMTGWLSANANEFRIRNSKAEHDGIVSVFGGEGTTTGANLFLFGTAHSSQAGMFVLSATDGANAKSLRGKADGTLTWNSQPLLPVGVVQAFAGTTIPTGWLLCDGSAVSRTDYAALYAVIGTTYGAGNGSTTFNLPNLVDKFVEGSATAGTVKSAGLPNITGNTDEAVTGQGKVNNTGYKALFVSQTGTSGAWQQTSSGDRNNNRSIGFDASRSSAIYGNSTTVQPPALTMRYIIKY